MCVHISYKEPLTYSVEDVSCLPECLGPLLPPPSRKRKRERERKKKGNCGGHLIEYSHTFFSVSPPLAISAIRGVGERRFMLVLLVMSAAEG